MSDIVERLRFDEIRCRVHFSSGIAGNIGEAADEIEQLRQEIRHPAMTQRAKEMRELAKDAAESIVSMARERDSTCELKHDESEVLESATETILDALRLAAQADAPVTHEIPSSAEPACGGYSQASQHHSGDLQPGSAGAHTAQPQADAPGEPCEQCSAIPPTEHHPDCMYYGDAPGGLDAATVEACMDRINSVRQAEAARFDDPKYCGQRGCDRRDALHDALRALRAISAGKKP